MRLVGKAVTWLRATGLIGFPDAKKGLQILLSGKAEGFQKAAAQTGINCPDAANMLVIAMAWRYSSKPNRRKHRRHDVMLASYPAP